MIESAPRTVVPDREFLGRADTRRAETDLLVDIETPDGCSAAVLVEYAAPHFAAGIVKESAFTVRLGPIPAPSAALRVRFARRGLD